MMSLKNGKVSDKDEVSDKDDTSVSDKDEVELYQEFCFNDSFTNKFFSPDGVFQIIGFWCSSFVTEKFPKLSKLACECCQYQHPVLQVSEHLALAAILNQQRELSSQVLLLIPLKY